MSKHTKKLAFMHACLPHVVFDGWSNQTWERGIITANISEGEAKRLFPAGIESVLEAFMDSLDASMALELQTLPLTSMKLGEQVEAAIMARLHAAATHREAVRRAVAWYALPYHAPKALSRLYTTTDRIWRAIHHHPTDFSFYTKRLSLSAIYSATLIFWLNDYSENFVETRMFLKRRLGNLFTFHKLKQKIKAGAIF